MSLAPLLNNLPPKTAKALTQAINICGQQLGIAPDWVQRWIAFTVVADALVTCAPDGASLFELKGGAAIELRLRQLATVEQSDTPQPRATKDLDVTFHGELDSLISAVESALRTPRHGFTFRAVTETPKALHMRRFRVRVAYLEAIGTTGKRQERDFSNVKLEVSTYEGTRLIPDLVPAFSLRPFGLSGPEHLPCMPLVKQIAQKIHAVTEVLEDGKMNDRFRDLVDLVILSAMAPASPELRAVCLETFTVRQKHDWPPEVIAYKHWEIPLERLARDSGLDQGSSHEIVAYVRKYIGAISIAGL